MLKLLLVFLGMSCVTRADKIRRTRQAVVVEVDLPWFIQFTVPKSAHFEPRSLAVNLSHPAERVQKSVVLTSQSEISSLKFRNSQPLQMEAGDVVDAVLEYKTRGGQATRRVAFTYTINSKQFDVLFLHNDLEFEANTEAADTESSDFCDELKDDVGTSQDSPSYMAPPSRQREEACVSPEAVSVMLAEKQFLEAQLQEALDLGRIGTRLVLTGSLPPGSNAVDAVRALITDKLKLPHLAQSITQARFANQELLFELSSPRQKLEVLAGARLKLQRSPYQVASTGQEVFETASYARSNNLH